MSDLELYEEDFYNDDLKNNKKSKKKVKKPNSNFNSLKDDGIQVKKKNNLIIICSKCEYDILYK